MVIQNINQVENWEKTCKLPGLTYHTTAVILRVYIAPRWVKKLRKRNHEI